jgi:hypothetical protein
MNARLIKLTKAEGHNPEELSGGGLKTLSLIQSI